jgi:antitoxin HigA-1
VYESDAALLPLHPGEVLREDFLLPLGSSAGSVVRACNVPRTRFERIAAEQIGISADTASRLGRSFGTSTEFWFNLQRQYERESKL